MGSLSTGALCSASFVGEILPQKNIIESSPAFSLRPFFKAGTQVMGVNDVESAPDA